MAIRTEFEWLLSSDSIYPESMATAIVGNEQKKVEECENDSVSFLKDKFSKIGATHRPVIVV